MSLTLRFARPEDAEIIERFVRELAEYEREPQAVQASAALYRQQLGEPNPPFRCLLADWQGEPAGIALFFDTYSTWRGSRGLHLEDLYVPAVYRRRGVARALMARLARVVREEGYGRLEWSVLHWNQPALAFYRAIGGEPLEDWRPYRMRESALDALAAESL